VKELQQDLGHLAKQHAELNDLRSAAHEAFLTTKADLQGALDGTRTVIRMLRDYYASDDDNNDALLQNDEKFGAEMAAPDIPEKFQKSSSAGGSIIGILEVCESDLARSLAEEETEEAGKQVEYEKLTQEMKQIKVQKEKHMEYKTADYKELDKAITEFTSDFDTQGEELDAVKEYEVKVKERCAMEPETFNERKEHRQAEIKGLQEALAMLESEGSGSLLQRGRKRGNPTTLHF